MLHSSSQRCESKAASVAVLYFNTIHFYGKREKTKDADEPCVSTQVSGIC